MAPDNPDVRVMYEEETGEAVLLIAEAFTEDQGSYQCIASNVYGTAAISAELLIECKQRQMLSYVLHLSKYFAKNVNKIVTVVSVGPTVFIQVTSKY